MDREQIKLLAAGAIVGVAGGFLLSRALYLGNGPMPQGGPVVMGPATGEADAPPQGTPPPAMGAGAADAPQNAQQQAMHQQIDALLARAKSDPKDKAARVQLGNITFDNGLYDIAVKFYEEAIALDGSDADVLTDAGICYRNMRQTERALSMFARAVQADPGHAKSWFDMALVKYADAKDMKGAREAIDKVIEIDPSFHQARELKARIDQGAAPAAAGASA